MKIRSIACSHNRHVDISKCMYCLDTQSVKVCWRYNISDINRLQLFEKIPKKRNKTKGHSITWSHI